MLGSMVLVASEGGACTWRRRGYRFQWGREGIHSTRSQRREDVQMQMQMQHCALRASWGWHLASYGTQLLIPARAPHSPATRPSHRGGRCAVKARLSDSSICHYVLGHL
jgi:hypothetical protein